MSGLANKRIILGVTGGISAYKSADLVRRLREAGADVRVVMTRAATAFVTPLTFQAVSGHPVHIELMDADAESAMGHIQLARWADATLVAPASADFLARLAHGRADDLLTTLSLCLATPLLVAPAMNQAMWNNPATRANVGLLARHGVEILGPGFGLQACGDVGPGRMLEPEQLVARLVGLFATGGMAGLRVLVTAGPTREALDPVRFLSNRSSGKMGYAVARACMEAGAEVTLVSGPVNLQPPERVSVVEVESARQMHEAVMQRVERCDIFVGAAAVADYRPRHYVPGKIKKQDADYRLELERNPDIITEVAGLGGAPFVVGFAAETGNLERLARSKLLGKGMDMIAANLVGDGLGFDVDDNALQLYWKDGDLDLQRMHKDQLARRLVEVIAERFHATRDNQFEESDEHAQGTTEDTGSADRH